MICSVVTKYFWIW